MWPIIVLIDDYRGILCKILFFLLLDERGAREYQRERTWDSVFYLNGGRGGDGAGWRGDARWARVLAQRKALYMLYIWVI